MKQLKFLPILLAGMVVGCGGEYFDATEEAKGELAIALCADGGFTITTKATEESSEGGKSSVTVATPENTGFQIDIFDASQTKVYAASYSDLVDRTIQINRGSYTLTASHGNPNSVGFDDAYFSTSKEVSITEQKLITVSLQPKMTKVMTSVSYGLNILAESYYDYYSIVRPADLSDMSDDSKYLTFVKDDERFGFIPAGSLVYEFYVQKEENGKWQRFKAAPASYNENTYVKYVVDLKAGQLQLNITADDESTVELKQDLLISWEARPKDPPTIDISGFSVNNDYVYIGEALASSTPVLRADIKAEGKISKCILNISSAYLNSTLGLPASVDLANIDENTAATLVQAGFRWPANLKGAQLASVDFGALIDNCAYATYNDFDAVFSLEVQCEKNKTVKTENYKIVSALAQANINAKDYNAFAKRVKGLTANVERGNPAKMILQYSADGGASWTDAPAGTVSDNVISMPDITGLTSNKGYSFRLVHSYDKTAWSSAVVNLTTETEAQLPNSGFEDWTTSVHNYTTKLLWSTKKVTKDWYIPKNGWAVNSMKSMPTQTTPEYQEYKCVPSVQYITKDKSEGSKAAQIISLHVGTGNSGSVVTSGTHSFVIGELFLGTADSNGNHSSDGCSFASRPQYLSFDYKYTSVNSNTYYVLCQVLDASGNVIAQCVQNAGQEASNWTTAKLPISYSVFDRKTASIRLSFKSSSKASLAKNDIKAKTTIEEAGQDVSRHAGSILKIDNLKMIYE